jgi:hypothetical protein
MMREARRFHKDDLARGVHQPPKRTYLARPLRPVPAGVPLLGWFASMMPVPSKGFGSGLPGPPALAAGLSEADFFFGGPDVTAGFAPHGFALAQSTTKSQKAGIFVQREGFSCL